MTDIPEAQGLPKDSCITDAVGVVITRLDNIPHRSRRRPAGGANCFRRSSFPRKIVKKRENNSGLTIFLFRVIDDFNPGGIVACPVAIDPDEFSRFPIDSMD